MGNAGDPVPGERLALALAVQLGEAYRGDWSDFDGRSLRDQMYELFDVASGKMTAEQYRSMNDLCPHGHGHWRDYCGSYHCDAEAEQNGGNIDHG